MAHHIQRDCGGGVRNARLPVQWRIKRRETAGGWGHHRAVRAAGRRLEARLREAAGRGVGPTFHLGLDGRADGTGGELGIARGRILELWGRGCGGNGRRNLLYGRGSGGLGGTGLGRAGIG